MHTKHLRVDGNEATGEPSKVLSDRVGGTVVAEAAAESSAAEPVVATSKSRRRRAAKAGGRHEMPEGAPVLRFAVLSLSVLALGPADRTPKSDDEDRDLAISLGRLGVLAPLVVRRDGGTDRYLVLAGKRRYQAAKAAGLTEVPCHVVEGESNPAIDALVALTENKVRLEMTPWDTAVALQRVLDATGLTQREVAKRFGLSAGTVSEYLQLLRKNLPEKQIAKLAAGTLSAKAVLRSLNKRPAATAAPARSRTPAKTGGADRQEWQSHSQHDADTGIYLAVCADSEPPLDNLVRAVRRWLNLLKKQAEFAARAGLTEGTQ